MIKSCKDGDAHGFDQANCDESATSHLVTIAAKQNRAPSPRKCRDFIRKQTANAMPDIVTTFVDKAKEGSVPHFTSLAKVGGFDQRLSAADTPKRRRKSLGRQLLEEVERYEKQQAAELAAANSQTDNGEPQERS